MESSAVYARSVLPEKIILVIYVERDLDRETETEGQGYSETERQRDRDRDRDRTGNSALMFTAPRHLVECALWCNRCLYTRSISICYILLLFACSAISSDSNPSHAPQSKVSVKETDFVNGETC